MPADAAIASPFGLRLYRFLPHGFQQGQRRIKRDRKGALIDFDERKPTSGLEDTQHFTRCPNGIGEVLEDETGEREIDAVLREAGFCSGCLDKTRPVSERGGQELSGALKQRRFVVEGDNLAVWQQGEELFRQRAWAAAQIKHRHAILQSKPDQDWRFFRPGQAGLLTQTMRFMLKTKLVQVI